MHLSYYLLPEAEGRGQENIQRLPYVRVCACLSIRHFFYINLIISLISKDIFTNFAVNVCIYENMAVQNFGLILKNTMAAMANSLKIIKML